MKEDFKEVLCNHCGLSCVLDNGMENYGLVNAVVGGGYFSTAGNGNGTLDDNTNYKFSLCEYCLDHLFQQFSIPPKVFHMYGEEESFRPARMRIQEDEWRKDPIEAFDQEVERHAKGRVPFVYLPLSENAVKLKEICNKLDFSYESTMSLEDLAPLIKIYENLSEYEKCNFSYLSEYFDSLYEKRYNANL